MAKVYFFLLIFVLCRQAKAQEFTYLVYGVENGLPTYFTKSIAQTPDNHIWIATDDGLVRFNGIETKVWKNELLSRYVKEVQFLDSTLYIITDNGIQTLSDDPNEPFEVFLKANKINSMDNLHYPKGLDKSPDGNLIVAEPQGLVILNGDEFKKLPVGPKYQYTDRYVKTFFPFFDSDKQLYTSALTGYLLKYDSQKDTLIEVSFSGKGPRPEIRDLIEYKKNKWLIAGQMGIAIVEKKTDKSFKWTYINRDLKVNTLHLLNEKYLLVATISGNVYSLNLNDGKYQSKQIMDFDNNGINDFFVSNGGGVWLSSDQGVVLLQPDLFDKMPFDQSNQYTQNLAISESGKVAATALNLLMEFRDGLNAEINPKREYYQTFFSLKALHYVGDTLLTGATDGKIKWIYNQEVFREIEIVPNDYQSIQHPFIIRDAPDGSIWVLVYNRNGVFRIFPDGRTKEYGADEGAYFQAFSMDISDDGDVVLGLESDDLFLYSYNKVKDEFEPLSFLEQKKVPFADSTTRIYEIKFADNGDIWFVGTLGLVQFDGNQFINHRTNQDIRYELFTSLDVDSKGNAWVGAQDGVFYYSDGVYSSFDKTDGLPTITVAERCIRVDDNDQVWIGTINGLAVQKRVDSTINQTSKPGVLSIFVNAKQIQSLPEVIVVNDESAVEINLISITFPSNKVEYLYKWNENDNWDFLKSPRFTFQDKKAGKYDLQIKAKERGSPVSETLIIPIQINQVWYRSGLAKFIYIIIFILISFTSFQYISTIRARNATERKLRQTEHQLRMVFQTTPMILIAIDRNGIITSAEGEVLNHEEEVHTWVGRPINSLFPDREFSESLSKSLKGITSQVDLQLFERSYHVRLVPTYSSSGKPSGLLIVGDDITVRAEMENKLIVAMEEAKQANQAKSMFLASMSHELRTPLNAILGFSEILLKDESINVRNKNFISILYKSGEHLLHMINDVLDLSKIEAGKLEIVEKPFDIYALLEDISSMFTIQAKKKNLNYSIKVDNNIPKILIQDESKIRQILINLISNAIKYTDKGSVNIHTDYVGGNFNVTVKDSGRGIPKEQLKDIFEPFKQVSGYTNKGTGLGLAICHHLSKLMGGFLTVSSKIGKGSTFHLRLPASLPSEDIFISSKTDQSKQAIKLISPQPILVDIVDDIKENRILIASLLEPLGFICRQSENGRECLNQFEEEVPDIVLMDIVMPIMNGRDALREIRSNSETKDIPVIAVTASGFNDEREKLMEEGFDDFLRKPFREQELLDAMSQILNIDYEYKQAINKDIDVVKSSYRNDELINQIYKLKNHSKEEILDAILTLNMDEIKKLVKESDLEEKVKEEILYHVEESDFSYFIGLGEFIEV